MKPLDTLGLQYKFVPVFLATSPEDTHWDYDSLCDRLVR